MRMRQICAGLIFVAVAWVGSAHAQSGTAAGEGAVKTYEKKATYDDVRFDLSNAIVNAGLNIASNGKIAEMLERTGEAVGSTKPIYKAAEFFTFCSAKVSREMMEADPRNVAFCPTTVFMYEAVGNPGVVVVGYRRPTAVNAQSAKAVADTEALLDKIVREAVQ